MRGFVPSRKRCSFDFLCRQTMQIFTALYDIVLLSYINKQFCFEAEGDKCGHINEKKMQGAAFQETRHIGCTEDISICVPLLGKPSITLSFIMGCEKCDWTSMEKESELWRDGSQLRVINICDSAGRLMDASITSAVSPTRGTQPYLCFTF